MKNSIEALKDDIQYWNTQLETNHQKAAVDLAMGALSVIGTGIGVAAAIAHKRPSTGIAVAVAGLHAAHGFSISAKDDLYRARACTLAASDRQSELSDMIARQTMIDQQTVSSSLKSARLIAAD